MANSEGSKNSTSAAPAVGAAVAVTIAARIVDVVAPGIGVLAEAAIMGAAAAGGYEAGKALSAEQAK